MDSALPPGPGSDIRIVARPESRRPTYKRRVAACRAIAALIQAGARSDDEDVRAAARATAEEVEGPDGVFTVLGVSLDTFNVTLQPPPEPAGEALARRAQRSAERSDRALTN